MIDFLNSLNPLLGTLVEAMWRLFLVIFVLPTQLLIRLFSTTSGSRYSSQSSKSQQDENARQAGCREVVLAYANHLGYIARECISREEIEKLIDDGISPDDLEREIQERIDEAPGIILGTQTYHHHSHQTPVLMA